MKLKDLKIKLAMITMGIGAPALHGMSGQEFGAAVSEAAPIAGHVLEQLGLLMLI